MSEFCLDNELKKWFNKWHRKVVTGRCLIELKDMNKEFATILNSQLKYHLHSHKKYGEMTVETKMRFDDIKKDIEKFSGMDLI